MLCTALGQPDKIPEALIIKQEELAASVVRGNDPDDYKSAAGSMHVRLRKLLGITTGGSTWHAFARDALAPPIQPGTAAYAVLRTDVFGQE